MSPDPLTFVIQVAAIILTWEWVVRHLLFGKDN